MSLEDLVVRFKESMHPLEAVHTAVVLCIVWAAGPRFSCLRELCKPEGSVLWSSRASQGWSWGQVGRPSAPDFIKASTSTRFFGDLVDENPHAVGYAAI